MSVRPAALDLQRERVEQSSAPPASSTPPQLARNDASAPSQLRKRTAHKPRRAVVRRRGARVDSESEQDDLDPQRANIKSRDSDSESDDLELPSSDDEDSEEEDDDGVAEPKTPATASVEQLPQSLDTATTPPPHQPPKSRKAVLTGQVLHPSWSDMPAPGEDGDTSLPTLDFSNLSLDVVQHLPSPPPRSRHAVASTSKAAALSSAPVPQPQPQASTAAAVHPGGLTKKQLQEQKRQAKLAALKQTDPEAAERIEKERQERLAAKRLAKKERLKEKKRERKALEHAARDASSHPAASQLEQDAAVPAAPPSAPNDKPARPAKSARPVVPSRPSRTAVALGLLGPESPPPPPPAASSNRPAPALPPSASATTPVVPAATRQPAFLPRDSEGRPIVQSLPPTTRPRAHHPTDDDHAASQWVRGRGGAPRGFGSYRGGRGAARFAHQQDRDEVSAHPDAAEEDRGFRGRGRGRGALARGGGFAGRGGRGVVATGPPGSINPRYAHLPFHPLHRFPSPSPAPKSASPAPSNRSTDQASNVGPEVTTASPDEQLFEAEAGSSASAAAAAQEKPTGVVKLPVNGAAQIMMTVKGAAAAQAARDHGASKENRPPPAESVDAAATSEVEPHKLSDPGILYASAPRRPTEQEAADSSVATSSEAPREPLSLLHQVPPHLQGLAGPPVVEQDAPAYYQQQQQPYSGPYWSSEAPEPYPISTPSPAPAPTDQQFGVPLAHPAPSSAYFVPPRPNKRVEIKNPSSRDGQSPAPSNATKSAPPAPVDALEAAREIRDAQILQQQEHQRQAEASYMHAMNYSFQQQQHAPAPPGRPPFPSSPTFTRDGSPIPANAPLPPPSVDQQAILQPLHAPHMYNPYPPAHVMAQQPPQPQPPTTTTTYELVAPYPSHYPAAAAYYAPQQQPMYQPTLSPPVGPPAGYYGGMYGARPVVYEEQPLPQWTGY